MYLVDICATSQCLYHVCKAFNRLNSLAYRKKLLFNPHIDVCVCFFMQILLKITFFRFAHSLTP